jgi:ferrous-iron efflux pump FieF
MVHNEKLVQTATIAAVLVAVSLIIGKIIAWYFTASLSIQASLVDSLLDGIASLINLVAVYHASRPADDCHRFGHDKAEALASLGQSIFIALSAFWLLWEAYLRFCEPISIAYSHIALVIMIGSTLLSIALVMWQTHVIKKTGSLVVQSDSIHYKADIFSNLGVLIVFGITSIYSFPFLDSFVGAGIAAYILMTSWEIAKKSADVLMDKELSDAFRQEITRIIREHPQALGIHEMRTRSSGKRKFVQLHLDLDKNLKLYEAHDIAEEIEHTITSLHPEVDIIIHQDPR